VVTNGRYAASISAVLRPHAVDYEIALRERFFCRDELQRSAATSNSFRFRHVSSRSSLRDGTLEEAVTLEVTPLCQMFDSIDGIRGAENVLAAH
jgi:hypothetical protein